LARQDVSLRLMIQEHAMRYVLIHYHIFKNAGTTVEFILDHSFGEHWTRFDGPDRNCTLTGQDLLAFLMRRPGVMALSSHHLRYPKPEAPGFVFCDLVVVRHPVDRIYSMYKFFKREPDSDDPVCVLAKTHELGGFIAELIEKYPQYVNDPQVNLLSNAGQYTRPPGIADLEKATNLVLNASAPAVADCFTQSMVAAEYFLHSIFPMFECRYVPQNVSPDTGTTLEERIQRVRNACGERLYKQVMVMTALDQELVDRSRAEVLRRLKLVPNYQKRLELLENELQLMEAQTSYSAMQSRKAML